MRPILISQQLVQVVDLGHALDVVPCKMKLGSEETYLM